MDILTLLPPVTAILIAVMARNVYAALIVALFLSEGLILLMGGTPLTTSVGEDMQGPMVFLQAIAAGFLGMIDRTVGVFADAGSARILLFSLLIGALIAYMRDSGGVAAMARALINGGFAKTPKRAEFAVAATGSAIFVETNVSLLSSGVLGRPLYDAHGMSRERLAYIIDSTSAPISVIIMLNAWGAYAIGLVEPYGFTNATGVVMGSIPWNFYALLTILGVYLTVFTGKVFGPLRTVDTRVKATETPGGVEPTKAIYMWLPLVVMVGAALGFMVWTGGGNITQGSGSQSILWAIALALVVSALMLRAQRVFNSTQLQDKAFQGIGEMVPMVTVLLLSISLGTSLRELGTGAYVSEMAAGTLPPFLVPAILFVAAGLTSFMTGTSWGTYGILVPIAMPLAIALGIPPSLALAAVLGGGVFGDHCSPISDTTLIASVAAGTDHLAHVRTQLPYALVAATGAGVLYLIAGWISV